MNEEEIELKKILRGIDLQLLRNRQEHHALLQFKEDIKKYQQKTPDSIIDITPIREQVFSKIHKKAEDMQFIKKEKPDKENKPNESEARAE